jgi:hypothetical protein
MKTTQIRPLRISLLVDIENITRSAAPSWHDAEIFHYRMKRIFGSPPDETFIASDPRNAFTSERLAEKYHGGFRVRSGKNGADLAIIDFLDEIVDRNRRLRKQRIGFVRIASGDGIFIPAIQRLQACNVHVTVISYRETTHHGLYRVADRVVLLDDTICHSVAV